MSFFRRKHSVTAEGFVVTEIAADAVGVDQPTKINIKGEPVVLTRLGAEIHAFNGRCPHAAGELTKGELYRGKVNCPVHGWTFDIATGRCRWPEDEVLRLEKYPVRVRDGLVQVQIDG